METYRPPTNDLQRHREQVRALLGSEDFARFLQQSAAAWVKGRASGVFFPVAVLPAVAARALQANPLVELPAYTAGNPEKIARGLWRPGRWLYLQQWLDDEDTFLLADKHGEGVHTFGSMPDENGKDRLWRAIIRKHGGRTTVPTVHKTDHKQLRIAEQKGEKIAAPGGRKFPRL